MSNNRDDILKAAREAIAVWPEAKMRERIAEKLAKTYRDAGFTHALMRVALAGIEAATKPQADATCPACSGSGAIEMGWVDGVCQRCKGMGTEAATQPANEAPSDAEIEAWSEAIRKPDYHLGSPYHDGLVSQATSLMRRLAAERARAVEALRGLVEAFSGESFLGDPKAQEEALRAAKEVLRG